MLTAPEQVRNDQHSLDLPARSGGLFPLRPDHETQTLPVHQTGTTPLLEWAGASYAVANAAPMLRARYDVVAAGGHCGVAEAIRRWRPS